MRRKISHTHTHSHTHIHHMEPSSYSMRSSNNNGYKTVLLTSNHNLVEREEKKSHCRQVYITHSLTQQEQKKKRRERYCTDYRDGGESVATLPRMTRCGFLLSHQRLRFFLRVSGVFRCLACAKMENSTCDARTFAKFILKSSLLR